MHSAPTVLHHETPALIAALSDSALRRASSAAIFQRGKTYASGGAVQVCSETDDGTPAVCATVVGTETYSTEVRVQAGEVGGSCDCANAQDGWFCKHQVALALVWRERLNGEAPVIDEASRKVVQASAKRVQTVKDRRQALHDFLRGQSAETLADRLMDLADRDSATARELQQWRKLSDAPQASADLKPLVTEILSPGAGGFISWNESYAYAHRAAVVLPLLAQARERDPAGAAGLCLHAMRRGWAVLMQADDSNGDIGGLIQAIGAEWVAALTKAAPQPAAFGDAYLQLQLDDPFGCFDTAAAEAAIGEAALTRYRKALAARWREAKDAVLAGKAEHTVRMASAKASNHREPFDPRDSERRVRLWTLERMHLAQLEAAADIDGALAVMREDVSEAASHHRITECLERHGRMREAFANAEQGCKAFPTDYRLQDDMLRCYERDGWVEEALALRRRRFDERPGAESYHQVLKAGAAAGRDGTALRDELQRALVLLEEQAMARVVDRPVFHRRVREAGSGQRDVSLRAEVLCSEGRWEEALRLVQPPAYCHDRVLGHLAGHLGPKQNAQRIELLMRVLASEMLDAKSPYRGELELVEEIAGLMDAGARALWLSQLRVEYKAKKNFVRDLPAA
jgi:tetratricopeptide (TPR) repeat protein